MKNLVLLIISLSITLSILTVCFLYSFNKCGWGMLAYEYPLIAALTGECAQQQRQLHSEQQ